MAGLLRGASERRRKERSTKGGGAKNIKTSSHLGIVLPLQEIADINKLYFVICS